MERQDPLIPTELQETLEEPQINQLQARQAAIETMQRLLGTRPTAARLRIQLLNDEQCKVVAEADSLAELLEALNS